MSDNLFSLSPIALSMGADPTDFLRLYKNVRFTHDELSIEENENVSPVGSAVFPSPTTLPELGPFNQWVGRLSSASEIFDSSTSGPFNAMLLRGSVAERQPYWESVSDQIDTLSESTEKYGAGAVTVAASRYQVLHGSESGHCCFGATVIDTRSPGQFETVCECFTVEDAHLVARALNSIGKEIQNEN